MELLSEEHITTLLNKKKNSLFANDLGFLKSLELHKTKYPTSEGYVFKSCNTKFIVVLKKLPDTKTNESRSNVKDPLYAKFRANKLLVVDIINKFTNNTINADATSTYKNNTITYKKDTIVQVDDFEENLNIISAPGIHYFQNSESAFYYGLVKITFGGLLEVVDRESLDKFNGYMPIKDWYDNGQLFREYAFGKVSYYEGLYKKWYDNGQLMNECTFKNGVKDGICKKWYLNGQLSMEGEYKRISIIDVENGPFKSWHDNGQQYQKCTFESGSLHGLFQEWDKETGKLSAERIYDKGEILREKTICGCWC
jgi:antitoxin component YwqK of YwqJK toxin-antitoxin module